MSSVALVTELFDPHVGGQEFRFEGFAKSLAKIGCKVDVFTCDHTGGNLPREETRNGFRVIRYVSLARYTKGSSRRLLPLYRYMKETSSLVTRISPEYDTVIINEMPLLHLLSLARKKKFESKNRARIVVDWCEYHNRGMVHHLIKACARGFELGTAVDDSVAENILRANPKSEVTVVRTPITIPDGSCTTKDQDLILFVGRLNKHKNLENLAKAVVELNLRYDVKKRLVIAGDGPLRKGLTEKFAKFKFIEIVGRIDEQTKTDLLRRAWIFAIPSLREGLPNTVAESVMCLTPILTVNSTLNNTAYFVRTHNIGFVARSPSASDIANEILAINEGSWTSSVGNERSIQWEFNEGLNSKKLLSLIQENSVR